jgi:hypothetical protein
VVGRGEPTSRKKINPIVQISITPSVMRLSHVLPMQCPLSMPRPDPQRNQKPGFSKVNGEVRASRFSHKTASQMYTARVPQD